MFVAPASFTRRPWQKWLIAWLLISMLFTTGFAPDPGSATPNSINTYVDASSSIDPSTLDPALAYDTVSGGIIQNIYETLVFYRGDKPDDFVPQLASSYQLSPDNLTWTFHIRTGVSFQNGASLSPSDVAYSLQRGILQGGSSSPQLLLTEPLLGVGIDDVSSLVDPSGSLLDNRTALKAAPPAKLLSACQAVQNAIVANNTAGTVTVHLAQAWAPFLATLAGTWGSILNKSWTSAHGGWDGSCSTWQNWYAPSSADDSLTAITNGSGPFKLDHWTKGTEIVLVRNDGYWRTPAKLLQVKIVNIPDASTRIGMLQSGAADHVEVASDSFDQANAFVGQSCAWNAATVQYDCTIVDSTKPLTRYQGRPGITQDELLINFNISNPVGGNPYIGSGLLDGSGIPVDFFSDVHIRKALNYCFNWDTYKQQVYKGNYVQPYTLPLQGMPGFDLSAAHYTNDLTKCAQEFGLADADHDGIPSNSDTNDVTEVGFHFKIAYNTGNTNRQAIAQILADNLKQVNSKFVVDVVELAWTDYLSARNASLLPVNTGGWMEDIHDPHNWYQPYTVGVYASREKLPDALISQYSAKVNAGVAATSFSARDAIYKQLNQLIYDNASLILLGGSTITSYAHRRVQGRLLNPIFPGDYYYPIYKATRTISGSLGVNGANATVNYTGGSTTAGSTGNYSFLVPFFWSGTVTPVKANTVFSPASRTYTKVQADQTSQNYTAKPTTTVQFPSSSLQDGWTLESSETSNLGGSISAAGTLRVGDSALNQQYRSILSFSTAAIPDTASIVKVTLKIKKAGLVGGNPFVSLGALLADVRSGYFGTSAALEANDFQAAASQSGIGSFSLVNGTTDTYQLVMKPADFTTISKTATTQFRLRFNLDDNNNHVADYLTFYAGDSTIAAYRPMLEVVYTVP